MSPITQRPPLSAVEPVTEVLHGVSITDPYRWLEDQNSPETRAWIEAQRIYTRCYLDAIPGRERIRERLRELLDVQTYDSFLKRQNRYFFRKRLPGQEQPCIYMRKGKRGTDQLLVDPVACASGKYTAVRPLRVSPDGKLLLYEVKEGGEYTGIFRIFDIEKQQNLRDALPRGFLRGFAFAPDSASFYYSHEPVERQSSKSSAYFHHRLGTELADDVSVFDPGENETSRLCLISDATRLGYVIYRYTKPRTTSFHIGAFEPGSRPKTLVANTTAIFDPLLFGGRIFALTDRDAPNFRIVEVFPNSGEATNWVDLVPQTDARISEFLVTRDLIFVSYARRNAQRIVLFDLHGKRLDEMPVSPNESIRLLGGSLEDNEVLLEAESFFEPLSVHRYSVESRMRIPWFSQQVPFDSVSFSHTRVTYQSNDGTAISVFLAGRRETLERPANPTIMTSYGGFGTSVAPQFSRLVAFLMERGCLFALPGIRGGAEQGADWHLAAQRRMRHVAHDDFLAAAEWLIATGHTTPGRLAIFGGSNSGLLVATAMTRRPDLFAAVLCLVPLLDMLRYHLFDHGYVWREEYGTADDPEDFRALVEYSPYHNIRPGTHYPPCLILSGDADGKCNPLHARKMTAFLQAQSPGGVETLLDYSKFRGHSPVLPLSDRIESLTDRLAFLCDKLQLPI